MVPQFHAVQFAVLRAAPRDRARWPSSNVYSWTCAWLRRAQCRRADLDVLNKSNLLWPPTHFDGLFRLRNSLPKETHFSFFSDTFLSPLFFSELQWLRQQQYSDGGVEFGRAANTAHMQ